MKINAAAVNMCSYREMEMEEKSKHALGAVFTK